MPGHSQVEEVKEQNRSKRHSAGACVKPQRSVAVAQLRAVVLMLITPPG